MSACDDSGHDADLRFVAPQGGKHVRRIHGCAPWTNWRKAGEAAAGLDPSLYAVVRLEACHLKTREVTARGGEDTGTSHSAWPKRMCGSRRGVVGTATDAGSLARRSSSSTEPPSPWTGPRRSPYEAGDSARSRSCWTQRSPSSTSSHGWNCAWVRPVPGATAR